MCGIAGLLTREPGLLRSIGPMTSLLRHRGPDDEGYLFAGPKGTVCAGGSDTPPAVAQCAAPYRPSTSLGEAPAPKDAWVAFGHRRLSIVDLSPLGHQPMSYLQRYWIIYNGEIYNHVELRTELEKLNCRFVSHSDTEVILAAYRTWGKECLSRFNGMWAFAIFDQAADTVFLARDRYGIKPLYYWPSPEGLAFASEIKAFTCLPHWRARLNGQAAHDYLLSGVQDHSRETFFEGVYQLEPGSCAMIHRLQWPPGSAFDLLRDVVIERWYAPQPQPFDGSAGEAATAFRNLLTDAVRLRLRADVPVGSCLSGGLDSSAIVCLANRLLRETEAGFAQKTFSACAQERRFDERVYIEKVVAATGVESHYVFPSLDELFGGLDALVWHQDEPFGSTSIFAQWCVFRLARAEQTKVMLDGQGADELLYGYPSFRRAFLAGLVRSGRWATAWHEAKALRGRRARALSLMARACTDTCVPQAVQRRFREKRKNQQPPRWLNPQRLQASFPGRLASRFQRHTRASELSVELITGAHLQMLLHWEDRNSMAHGVESRLPFLDYRMVEFALGLPDEFKLAGGLTKAVLRNGLQGLVPPEILQRTDKMGFVTPEELWAKEQGAARFRSALAEAVEVSAGVLTESAAPSFEEILSGAIPYSWSIWRMICFGRWLKRFKVEI